MITIKEASIILGISRQAVWLRIKTGKLKAKKYGRQWLIKEKEVNGG